MTAYIVSTLSASMDYRNMSKPKTGKDGKWTNPPQELKSVTINGGANISPGISLLTPKGVCTPIDDEQYEWLKSDTSFKRHVERGFMAFLENAPDANAVAGSMKAFDGSAPQNVDSGNATHVPQATEA